MPKYLVQFDVPVAVEVEAANEAEAEEKALMAWDDSNISGDSHNIETEELK
jgi:hypothetical protein